MGFSIYRHSSPSMLYDLDMCGVDVLVGVGEMNCHDGREELRWVHGVLLCHDIGSLLHGVCRHHDAVVGFRVANESQFMPALWGTNSITYDVSMSPSSNTHTVISVTD